MLLEKAGHEVLLFEARDRAGGRIHTADSGFEIGAEWVDEDHERMRWLLRKLRIAEVPAPPGDYLLSYQGSKCMEGQPWPEAAEDVRRFEALASGASPEDGDTVDDLVRASCTSGAGNWLVTANIRTDEGDEPENLGLGPWLEFRKKYAHREGREGSAYRIDGGGRWFIDVFLSKLEASPAYGSVLRKVIEGSEVELVFDGFNVRADAAILALPVPCLNEIMVSPEVAVASELRRLEMAPAVKARFTYASPFWEAEGWHGYLKSDHLVQQTWPDRDNRNALVGYICADAARTLHRAAQASLLLSTDLSKVSPSAALAAIEVKDWVADPFARGAFATAPPGSNPGAVRARESRKVQLAGEFCASWMGFMEGALESAEEAVESLTK